MLLYYAPLNGPAKSFGTPEDSFWCCYGTGIENHAKHGDSIYFHDGDKSLWVNLFVASELTWQDLGLALRQDTQFPERDTSRLTFTCQKPVRFTLHVRHPSWAASGIQITMNGRQQTVESRPGSYVSLTRQWQTGDTVDIRVPMTVRIEAFRDNPRRVAILYGPLVLCSTVEAGKPAPVIVSAIARIPSGVAPAEMPLCFKGSPAIFRRAGAEQGVTVMLIPFYREYQQAHVVYWDVLSAVPPTSTTPAPGNIRLVNAGFESDELLRGWSLHVYGAQPKIAADVTIRHEGHQSLRISAADTSDTALGQEVTTLTVTDEPICRATISPYQYGQFIEYLCGLTPSMFAEQVFDGSFEGVPALPCRIPQGHGSAGEAVVSGRCGPSRRLRPRPRRGFQRQSIPTDHPEARRPLHAGSLARGQARQSGRTAAVFAIPSCPGTPIAGAGGDLGARPNLRECDISTHRAVAVASRRSWSPPARDPSATLSISFRGPGTLWIDQVSLMPTDNVFGWRRDVAEALKALRPGIIRFGGSTTEGFEWTATIGDPAKRVPFTTCWGGLEPGNAGLEEFVQLCRWVGAEPLICVRFTGRTAQTGSRAGGIFQRSGRDAHGQTAGPPTGTPRPTACGIGKSATSWATRPTRRESSSSARP